jgi:precorrin-2 dehydrogenase/sirohydrochlorin ferrochelatase
MCYFCSMNTLYPVFLKTENFNILIVGGGEVATEKLGFLLKSSPNANIQLVATWLSPTLEIVIKEKKNINVKLKAFEPKDIKGCSFVIAATNDAELNKQIWKSAKERNILINVADTPELCDVYLGAIITKGDLKIAISTNGKSPTMAKRIKEFLEESIPDDFHILLDNLESIRKKLKVDFESKTKILNEITKNWTQQED